MQKNELLKKDESIIRVLDIQGESVLIIDCIKRTMPKWVITAALSDYVLCSESELFQETDMTLIDMELLDADSRRFVHEHFTLIAGILPFVGDKKMRNHLIDYLSGQKGICKRTIGNYLCLYLVYQDISALAPKQKTEDKPLTKDEKNMRWALNKFFYNQNKNSLPAAYTMMLKERYCDSSGILLPEYPSIHQFKYFYYKNRKLQNYYISRGGLKDYQKNYRPLLGDGVQEYASAVGMGMLDATVCDIYLVNEAGNLVGRPILTACIDAYSSLCCGYSLSWEGGTYSLRGLMVNVLSDKVEWCRKHGVFIQKEQWDSNKLPSIFVTDMGSEYKSETFEQIADLGVTVINLPSYRPELKGSVEKFFDLVQDTYKKHLKGKGVIEPDYQERGSHDYRKDACLTMADFEKVVLHCIVYYNSQRIVENFPYTEEMLQSNIEPYANSIFEWGKKQLGANLIQIDIEQVVLTLLPRTIGKFCRNGLKVNKLRYKNENFTEKYLSGGEVTVAYNPDDVSCIWLIENGAYIRFELIESRFRDMGLPEVQTMQTTQKELVKAATKPNLQAQIELANHIEAIVSSVGGHEDVDIKGIRKCRQRERDKSHVDYVKDGVKNV